MSPIRFEVLIVRLFTGLILSSAVVLLAGCATGPGMVVAQVNTTVAQPPDAVLQAPRYRFEQGPVTPGQPAQAKLRRMAAGALASVGARRDDANPNVSVRVIGQVTMGSYDNSDGWGLPPAYWGDPAYFGFGRGVGDGWYGNDGTGWPGDERIPIYTSRVELTLRDVATGKIVYDTRARHVGATGDTTAVLATLFAAALQGYPNPPTGAREVDMPLPPPALGARDNAAGVR